MPMIRVIKMEHVRWLVRPGFKLSAGSAAALIQSNLEASTNNLIKLILSEGAYLSKPFFTSRRNMIFMLLVKHVSLLNFSPTRCE